MLDAVSTWDPDGYDNVLIDVPAFRTHREAADEAARRLAALGDAFDDIADWQSASDCEYTLPIDEDIAAGLKIGPLAALLGGLADLQARRSATYWTDRRVR